MDSSGSVVRVNLYKSFRSHLVLKNSFIEWRRVSGKLDASSSTLRSDLRNFVAGLRVTGLTVWFTVSCWPLSQTVDLSRSVHEQGMSGSDLTDCHICSHDAKKGFEIVWKRIWKILAWRKRTHSIPQLQNILGKNHFSGCSTWCRIFRQYEIIRVHISGACAFLAVHLSEVQHLLSECLSVSPSICPSVALASDV